MVNFLKVVDCALFDPNALYDSFMCRVTMSSTEMKVYTNMTKVTFMRRFDMHLDSRVRIFEEARNFFLHERLAEVPQVPICKLKGKAQSKQPVKKKPPQRSTSRKRARPSPRRSRTASRCGIVAEARAVGPSAHGRRRRRGRAAT